MKSEPSLPALFLYGILVTNCYPSQRVSTGNTPWKLSRMTHPVTVVLFFFWPSTLFTHTREAGSLLCQPHGESGAAVMRDARLVS